MQLYNLCYKAVQEYSHEPIKVLIEMHLLSGSAQAFSFERIGKLKYKTKVKGQAIVDKYVSVH